MNDRQAADLLAEVRKVVAGLERLADGLHADRHRRLVSRWVVAAGTTVCMWLVPYGALWAAGVPPDWAARIAVLPFGLYAAVMLAVGVLVDWTFRSALEKAEGVLTLADELGLRGEP